MPASVYRHVHAQTDIPATAAAALDAPFDFDATFTANYRRIARLRAGRGIVVGDDEGICFFWNTPDRLFIVSAPPMSDADLITLADSFRTDHSDN